MDLEEFNSVLRDTTPALDESDILKMFAEALLETGALSDGSQGSGDIDSIHPQVTPLLSFLHLPSGGMHWVWYRQRLTLGLLEQAFSYVARRFQLLPRKAVD